MNEVLKTIAAKYKDDIVHTASELIQRNSQSLHEGEVAAYVQEKMKELGKLKRVLHYPAHKVYEVKGAREYLIPAVPGVFIASVDIDAGVVRIHNMKGLAIDEN